MICMTTQCYDLLSGWIRNLYVGIILVELNIIWNFYWNTERTILFKTVIFSMSVGCLDQEINMNGFTHDSNCGKM